MATDDAEIVVVGAGLMGAASTLALARRGHAVTTLEARRVGHREGSSHGSSRIFRHSYVEPHYVEMTVRALGLWRELEELCGNELLTTTGGLDHGERRGVEALYAAQRAAGIPCEPLSPEAAAERWPHMRFASDVLFTPGAGVIDPELAIAEMLRLAESLGARLLEETPVIRVEPLESGVRIVTPEQTLHAGAVVVAAGAWLPGLLAGVVRLPQLTVTQQQVFHFARRDEHDLSTWPVVLYECALSAYGLPGGRDGVVPGNVKLALHDPSAATTPDERDGRIDPAGRRHVIDHARHWWPGLVPEPLAGLTCLYTSTADERFVLDRVGPVVVCSPCSGHGAKFTPIIGEWVADLAEGRQLPFTTFGLRGRT